MSWFKETLENNVNSFFDERVGDEEHLGDLKRRKIRKTERKKERKKERQADRKKDRERERERE